MDEIGLQDLIYQVKQELLAPNPDQQANDPDPLFFIDNVEIEVAVKFTKEGSGGVKVSVLGLAELNASGSAAKEHGHVVKVSLSPLLPKEEILTKLLEDPQIVERVRDKQQVLLRDVTLAGTPE